MIGTDGTSLKKAARDEDEFFSTLQPLKHPKNMYGQELGLELARESFNVLLTSRFYLTLGE